MKNLKQKKGFINRHTNRLPEHKCTIRIVTKDIDGEHIFSCEWSPFNKSEYSKENMPSKGYLGSARVIEGEFKGIGFNAWEQNNSEFVYYSIEKKIINEKN
mgnify:FL=1